MKWLGLDFETTGLNEEVDRVIEIGAVVWNMDVNAPECLYSELVLPDDLSEISQEIVNITGITMNMLEQYGIDSYQAFTRLKHLIDSCDVVVAHNMSFDRKFFDKEMSRLGLPANKNKLWVDSMTDVPYPETIATRKLTYLAADHGIVNPFAHRALFDVITMMQLVSNYSEKEILQRAQSPNVEVISHVSYDEREAAKQMGFRWDGQNKKWARLMKLCDVEHQNFPFQVTVVEY